jgi:hypothetical protein
MWGFLRRRRSESSDEATAAVKDAQKHLNRVRKRDQEVSDLSDSLREVRQRNHFAEQMEEIIIRRGEVQP